MEHNTENLLTQSSINPQQIQHQFYQQQQQQQTQFEKNTNIPSPTFFSAKQLAQITTVFLVGGIILSYLTGLHYGKIEAFPAQSITQMVLNYPVFIVFRMLELPGALLLLFSWYVENLWLQNQANNLSITVKNSKIMSSAFISIIFLYVALASLDMEEMNYNIYAYSTVLAYGFTLLTIISVTSASVQIRQAKETSITDFSYYWKLLISLALIILTIYAFMEGYVWNIFLQTGGTDLNAFGFIYTLLFALYPLSFVYDLDGFILDFEIADNSNSLLVIRQQQQQQYNQQYNQQY